MKNFILFLLIVISSKASSQTTYTSDFYSYRVNLPSGFIFSQKSGFDVYATGPYLSSIGVMVKSLPTSPTASEFNSDCTNEILLSQFAKGLRNPQISSRGIGTANGRDYAYFVLISGSNDKLKMKNTLFFNGNYMYWILTSSGVEHEEVFRKDFKSVVDSFNLF
ncbi:hypothetical protein OIU80_18520 [Flavobacterium sp. LS1R47]|jgi:hypothetical protein|uniref:PsbP C-terminal domain-containing protein n=1 Tax=Flavobacterium frigoritolerans TaxID=2987686 RepID=A0A9X3C9X0_9FLAO|nr:hypothetical protein [Flavobacterium frigoritolerans]MCV9934277.1 hypothetical protein [Flavobacterium frigoritolerans]